MAAACTDAEWKIMEVLWESQPRTMAEITRALEPETGWTRHTVITLLKRMQEKGSVSVDESGPVKRYAPRMTRLEASADQTQRLLSRVFHGKASLLLHSLVDAGQVTAEEMRELLEMLEQK